MSKEKKALRLGRNPGTAGVHPRPGATTGGAGARLVAGKNREDVADSRGAGHKASSGQRKK